MKEKILGLSSNRLATQEAQRLWLKIRQLNKRLDQHNCGTEKNYSSDAKTMKNWLPVPSQKPAISPAHQTKGAVSKKSGREGSFDITIATEQNRTVLHTCNYCYIIKERDHTVHNPHHLTIWRYFVLMVEKFNSHFPFQTVVALWVLKLLN